MVPIAFRVDPSFSMGGASSPQGCDLVYQLT
jgi:hypothetical protein